MRLQSRFCRPLAGSSWNQNARAAEHTGPRGIRSRRDQDTAAAGGRAADSTNPKGAFWEYPACVWRPALGAGLQCSACLGVWADLESGTARVWITRLPRRVATFSPYRQPRHSRGVARCKICRAVWRGHDARLKTGRFSPFPVLAAGMRPGGSGLDQSLSVLVFESL